MIWSTKANSDTIPASWAPLLTRWGLPARTVRKIEVIGIAVDGSYILSSQAILDTNVQDRIKSIIGDALQFDWSNATHVFLYLVPKGIQLLFPK
jgi:hypothetical protein